MTAIRPKWIVITSLLVGLIVIQYLNFTGFCYRQCRYYSDHDLMDIVSKYGRQRYRNVHTINYSSLDDLIASNPNYCKIYRWGHRLASDGVWTRVFGWHIVYVLLGYKIRSQPPNNYLSIDASVNACGFIVESSSSVQSRD